MTGILISDYFLVRKQKLRVDDLYVGNEDSVYWYFEGFNWRAFTAWVMGLWPLLRQCSLTRNHWISIPIPIPGHR